MGFQGGEGIEHSLGKMIEHFGDFQAWRLNEFGTALIGFELELDFETGDETILVRGVSSTQPIILVQLESMQCTDHCWF